MPKVAFDISNAAFDSAKRRAAESGFPDVESYVKAVVEDELATADTDLERLLLERLNDPRPAIEATPEVWNDLHRRLSDEVAKRTTS